MTTRILFVCTGNTCRSPLAEGLFRMLAKQEGLDAEFRSAGVSAMDGTAVSRHSGDILQDKGALEGVTASKSLQEEAVRWSDLILTMTVSHKRAVLSRFPDMVDKVFTVKEYVEDNSAVLDTIRMKEALAAELQMKHALGQPITPEEREKLLMLDQLTPDFDISDPFGGSRREYDKVARELEQAAEKLIRKLKSI